MHWLWLLEGLIHPYPCPHVYIHTCMPTRPQVHTSTHAHPQVHTHTSLCAHAYIYMCTPTHAYPCIHTCTLSHVHPHIYMCTATYPNPRTPMHPHVHTQTSTRMPIHIHAHSHPVLTPFSGTQRHRHTQKLRLCPHRHHPHLTVGHPHLQTAHKAHTLETGRFLSTETHTRYPDSWTHTDALGSSGTGILIERLTD